MGSQEPNPFLSQAERAQWQAVCLRHNKVLVRQSWRFRMMPDGDSDGMTVAYRPS
jgi:hypothetical protein